AAVPRDVAENLRALGYVGGHPPLASNPGPLPDPKDEVAAYEAYRRAGALHGRGRDEEAVAALRKALAETPGMVDAWELLGIALVQLGRTREAVAALDEVVRLDPTHAGAHLALARIDTIEGRMDRALRHAELAAAT